MAVLLSTTIGAAAIGLVFAVALLNRPTRGPVREVTVEKGSSVGEIARLLHRRGVIRSPKLLRAFAILRGTGTRLTAGVHPFARNMTAWEVLEELEVPRDITQDITIPEGLRLEQTASLLAEGLSLEREKILEMASDPQICRDLGIRARTLEGYLFPETYRLSATISESQILRIMVEHFFKVFDAPLRRKAGDLDMSIHEVVTLASIIEGEAQVDAERPIIAAVYHNRLRRRMRLQADPTVQYAIGGGPRRLFYKDYEFDSPYNTYRHRGLPPGPITSPGEASIRAALCPADVAYLYFVARGDGSHLFSKTAREHEIAKRKTRRARRRTWSRSSTQ